MESEGDVPFQVGDLIRLPNGRRVAVREVRDGYYGCDGVNLDMPERIIVPLGGEGRCTVLGNINEERPALSADPFEVGGRIISNGRPIGTVTMATSATSWWWDTPSFEQPPNPHRERLERSLENERRRQLEDQLIGYRRILETDFVRCRPLPPASTSMGLRWFIDEYCRTVSRPPDPPKGAGFAAVRRGRAGALKKSLGKNLP